MADGTGMSMISLFERSIFMAEDRCDRCDKPAWASTPHGLRCDDHAIDEVQEAVAMGECDWVPQILRRRGRRS